MVHDSKKSAEQCDAEVQKAMTKAMHGPQPAMPTMEHVDAVVREGERVRDDPRNWSKP